MKKRFFWLSALLIVLLGMYFSYPSILEGMARFLIVRDKIEPVDVIVVLGGNAYGDRVNEAVRLYKNGYAKKILMSGGPLAWRLTDAEWMKKQALFMGVPSQAVLLEDKSESTIDNALLSLPIIKKHKFSSLILITSPTHSLRAKQVFEKVFVKNRIKVLSYPAEETKFRLPKWWTRHEDTQLVVWEYVSLVLYFLKGY